MADISLEIFPGEIFCVMGLSGSGKSTLVRHLNRLIEPTSGEVIVLGRDIMKITDNDLRDLRARRIGMVFQHMALFPHRPVRDNVAFPLEVQGESKARRRKISQNALSMVNLDGFEDRMPHELSGGMRQRVGLARALASDPEILLMDEPFSALDPLIRRQLQGLFLEISRRLKKTTVFITHDLEEAASLGDRIAIMKDGGVVQIGTPEEIIMNPRSGYVAEFVRDISKLKYARARAVMRDIKQWSGGIPEDAPRVDGGMNLSELVGLVSRHESPVVITDSGIDAGVVSRDILLRFMKKEAE
ncbi:MAG: betaine/proline/choline family ABC transporter ATP-binding protein [Gammaproteobacteria bacterium]